MRRQLPALWFHWLSFAAGLGLVTARADLVVAWNSAVRLYDERSGASLGHTTNSYRGETLTSVAVGPDGNIYAPENFGGPGSVIRFDGRTGNVTDEFVPYADFENVPTIPSSIGFGPGGDLFVGSM